MAANWWYNLVARRLNQEHAKVVFANAAQKLTIDNLREKIDRLEKDVKRLEQPTPLQQWVDGSRAHAAKKRNEELERELAKMGLVRDALRNEKAYTLFLEDCLECKNPSEVFNALPLEKRKEYFEKTS